MGVPSRGTFFPERLRRNPITQSSLGYRSQNSRIIDSKRKNKETKASTYDEAVLARDRSNVACNATLKLTMSWPPTAMQS